LASIRTTDLTAGYEGKIRVFNTADGKLAKDYVPFPLEKHEKIAAK
jgi:hypothetical protein